MTDILKKNLNGEDRAKISLMLGISLSKLNNYITGAKNDSIELKKIVDAAINVLSEKYNKLKKDIELLKNNN